jgi:hypothetical protein
MKELGLSQLAAAQRAVTSTGLAILDILPIREPGRPEESAGAAELMAMQQKTLVRANTSEE